MSSRGVKFLKGIAEDAGEVLSEIGGELEDARSFTSDAFYEFWLEDYDKKRERAKARAERTRKIREIKEKERKAKAESMAKLSKLKEQMKKGVFKDLSEIMKLNQFSGNSLRFEIPQDYDFLDSGNAEVFYKNFLKGFTGHEKELAGFITSLGIEGLISGGDFVELLALSFTNAVMRKVDRDFYEQFPLIKEFADKPQGADFRLSFDENSTLQDVEFIFRPDDFVSRYKEYEAAHLKVSGEEESEPEGKENLLELPEKPEFVGGDAPKADIESDELEKSRLEALINSPLGTVLNFLTFSSIDPATELTKFQMIANGMSPFMASIAGFLGVEGYEKEFNMLLEVAPEDKREKILAKRESILNKTKEKTSRPEKMQQMIDESKDTKLDSYLVDNLNGIVNENNALRLAEKFDKKIKIDLTYPGSFVFIPKNSEYAINEKENALAVLRSSSDKAFAGGTVFANNLPSGAVISPGAVITLV
ncbi:hypothetical protein GF354_03905 [Candidatus Peregrinibacteria bacterium]|nr:hypothetical protein [Candidatus Peregrinibacteria bacterium]